MQNIYKLCFSLTFLIFSMQIFADNKASISGSDFKVIEIQPETNTGLNNIFVVYNTSGCDFNFTATNGYAVYVYRYSNLGGGYAEELRDVDRNANSVSFPLGTDDLGYIIEDGTARYYYWVVNYAKHKYTVSSVVAAEQQDCNYSVVNFQGEASPITFYTINGQPRVLSREIYVDYTTQEFDSELSDYMNIDTRKIYESLGSTVAITPPAYCSTFFTIDGDRFLREWGFGIIVETSAVAPVAVECQAQAVQKEIDFGEDGSNVMKGDEANLGGSAPAEISFIAYTTEGVLHYEWQMSRNQDFETPDYRFYQKDLDYTFTEEGTFYLRFIGSNADGTCESVSDTFTVSIGASALECPNAFSPNGDGVNDIWKVSYRSLIDFSCEIFNRNGQRIYGFTDPSDGWDGTWHGKTVKPGVYYYVIIATGADGKRYKKSGDINIINSINYSNGGSTSEDYSE